MAQSTPSRTWSPFDPVAVAVAFPSHPHPFQIPQRLQPSHFVVCCHFACKSRRWSKLGSRQAGTKSHCCRFTAPVGGSQDETQDHRRNTSDSVTWHCRYADGDPLFGFRSPSNIVRSRIPGDSQHLYAFVTTGWGAQDRFGQSSGACIMRTTDLTDPASWRAWDGQGFTVPLAVNPYLTPIPNPESHRCLPVTNMT